MLHCFATTHFYSLTPLSTFLQSLHCDAFHGNSRVDYRFTENCLLACISYCTKWEGVLVLCARPYVHSKYSHLLSDTIRPSSFSFDPLLVSFYEYKLTTTIVQLISVSLEKTPVHQQVVNNIRQIMIIKVLRCSMIEHFSLLYSTIWSSVYHSQHRSNLRLIYDLSLKNFINY